MRQYTGAVMNRRRRILLTLLAVAAALAAAGVWALREGIYLERLPPEVRAQMPAHWRIPWGLAPEVRQGIEGLYSAEKDNRLDAAHDLGNLGPDAAPAVPFLVAMLARDVDGSGDATSQPSPPALKNSWPQRAWDWVMSHFPREGRMDLTHEAEGDAAAYALADIGRPAVEPLLAALQGPLPQVRARAAVALGLAGDERAAKPLVDIYVARWSDWITAQWPECQLSEVFERAIKDLGAPVTEPLVQALRDADSQAAKTADRGSSPWDVRPNLLDFLSLVGDERAAPFLRELAARRSTDPDLQGQVAGILPRLSLPRLQRLLEAEPHGESTPDAFQNLDESLLAIPSPNDTEAIDELIAKLDTSPLAAEVLAKSGSDRAAAALVRAAADMATHQGKANQAIEVPLFNLGDRAVDALEQALYNDSAAVRSEAADLLGRIATPRAVDALLGRLADAGFNDPVEGDLVLALGLTHDPRAFDPLVAILAADPGDGARGAAAEALGALGDPRAFDLLVAALDSHDTELKCAAAYGLGLVQDRRAVPILLEFSRRLLARKPFGPDHVVMTPTDDEALYRMKPLMAAAGSLVALREPQGITFWGQGAALEFPDSGCEDAASFADRIAGMGPAIIGPVKEALALPQCQPSCGDYAFFPAGPFCALAALDDPRADELFWRSMPAYRQREIMQTLMQMQTLGRAKAETILARIARTDRQRIVRREAVGHLAALGTPSAMAVIREVAAKDRCRTVRHWAEWVLAGGTTPGEAFDASYPGIWPP